MNILHVTREMGSDARYGIRKSLTPVLEALRQRGHAVTLFDQDDAFRFTPGSLMTCLETLYVNALRRRFGDEGALALNIIQERIRVARAVAAYAAQQQVTHVHCHDPLLARAYAFFAPLYGATRCWGYSAHAHGRFVQLRLGVETNPASLAYLQNWEHWAARQARWVVAISRSGMVQMAHDLALALPPAHWHVIPHAVAKPETFDRQAARQGLGLMDNDRLVVAVGQLIPLKRFSLLLDAVALLPAALRPRVLILGEGPEQAALLHQAEQLGLKERFDIRVTDHIGQYLAAADIYASVSSTESYGMANCEALLAGVPAVCTAVGAVPEILGDGALLVSDDAEQIAAQLAGLLGSAAARSQLVAKAEQQIKAWLNPEAVASILETVYAGTQTQTRI